MSIAVVALIAVALFTLPGAVLGWISGLKTPWAMAAGVPVSFGVFGIAGWLLGLTPWRFGLLSATLVWLGFALIAALWRLGWRAWGRSRQPGQASPDETAVGGWRDPVWLLPAGGSLLGAAILIYRGLRYVATTPDGMSAIFQGWDVHWHANVVRYALEEGMVSPTRMGELHNIETHDTMYYPTGWHAGADLLALITGISPIEATNYTAIIVPGLGIPLSVALIAWRMLGRRGLTGQLAAAIAGVASVIPPVLFWIGYYVGFWPYLAAIAVSGITLALFMAVPYRPVAILAAALALMGTTQLHPQAIAVTVMGLGLWWLLDLLWRPSPRGRLRDAAALAVAGVAGLVLLIPQILVGAGETETVASFSATEDISRAESIAKALKMTTRHTDFFDEPNFFWIYAFAIAGALIVLVWRRAVWAVGLWAVLVLLTINALVPFGGVASAVLGKVGDLFYNTPHRLILPVAMLVFASASIALACLIRVICLAPWKRGVATATASVVVAVPATAVAAYHYQEITAAGAARTIQSSLIDDHMVSDVDRRAWDWLAKQPHAYDTTIFGEPADGYGWMYAYNALPSISRHYMWPSADAFSATDRLYWRTNLLGEGNYGDPDQKNLIDQAAEDLNVAFIYVSPPLFWVFQNPNWNMIDGLWHTRGVTPVYQEENVSIFAVNAQFTDAELDAMRAPGNSPWALPELPEGGYFRPTKEPDPDAGSAGPLISFHGADDYAGELDPAAAARGKGPVVLTTPSIPSPTPAPSESAELVEPVEPVEPAEPTETVAPAEPAS